MINRSQVKYRGVQLRRLKIKSLFLKRSAAFVLAIVALAFYNDPALAQNITIGLGDGNSNGGDPARRADDRPCDDLVAGPLNPHHGHLFYAHCRRAFPVTHGHRRTAIPPNSVIISLALFLTAFIMTPVLKRLMKQALPL